jgi:hypothetical protein
MIADDDVVLCIEDRRRVVLERWEIQEGGCLVGWKPDGSMIGLGPGTPWRLEIPEADVEADGG